MTESSERTLRVLRKPQGAEEARRFAKRASASCGRACCEAAETVAGELAENMIKYGAEREGVFAGTITVGVHGDTLRVTASNDVATPSDAEHVRKVVAAIAAAKDVKALYRSRLEVLFRSPGFERAQLGLLRVAYEGLFRLACRYEPPRLTVVAERTCRDR